MALDATVLATTPAGLPNAGGPQPTALVANAREASELLKAMAHEGRLVILALLGERERSVTELESMLAIRQPAVSQQLARLRADELVQTRREGKLVYYSLASDSVREIIRTMIRMYQS
ncbi:MULTISPECIES: ArsR/SmtB family transcription factor [Hyphomicrobiales]|jgi:DNA-binding transcriptional ArsR family regulator|uniref:HTH arsR-type domain-containing protein n=2 Tax=Prosthecodimorpha TaxID=2981530 RepID=A0A0P6VWS4_9HYPH|nr:MULTISPECIES: metalloregulator ArsR/SmtB family transcription factor [Hyphomicrobiales]KPL55615.1 hypothetical protein ABB55_01740 [Prosthecomicrobium hirschii]MBT9292305.1 metalloregulator ArsR/SmtB family transcription factor [Prosthecodimorpha staleyi]MCW1839059.1 metalloregulator ArsR/SmtB family transcription factor [Prosthecomicrobium hirschii]TPQ45326.1 transcriptional regulator [Prosthecomicrobium hirschii]